MIGRENKVLPRAAMYGARGKYPHVIWGKAEDSKVSGIGIRKVLADGGVRSGMVKVGGGEKAPEAKKPKEPPEPTKQVEPPKEPIKAEVEEKAQEAAIEVLRSEVEKEAKKGATGLTETEERLSEYLGVAEVVVNHPEELKVEPPKTETAELSLEMGEKSEERPMERMSRRKRRRLKREARIKAEAGE